MNEQDEAIKTLIALADRYTHLIGSPEDNAPLALLDLGSGQASKPDRQEGVPRGVFEVLWHSGWIELELQASDLVKRLYRISPQGRAYVERLQSTASEGAGI